MKNLYKYTILTASCLIILCFNSACKNSDATLWDEDSPNYAITDSDNPYAVVVVADSSEKTELFAEVQDDPKDLYIGVFNNSNSYISLPSVTITDLGGRTLLNGTSLETGRNDKAASVRKSNYDLAEDLIRGTIASGTGEIMAGSSLSDTLYDGDIEGTTTYTFLDSELADNADGYECILQKIVPAGTDTPALKIWVENACWDDGTATEDYPVNTMMITALVDKFLETSDNFNDIYDWVTTIFGKEWGSHEYSNLIPDFNEINIVMADLLHDDLGDSSGVVLGYFWDKDNFVKTSNTGYYTDISNQRLTFYIEANYLAYTENGGTWSIDSVYSQEIISTLAHEFQHMINFYQTSVLNNTLQDTWLNELLSMATEDLLSDPDKLNINGPKGFNRADGTAPPTGSGITEGRIVYYALYPDVPFYFWQNDSYVLLYYSLNYVYGAYLMRNFGGPEVLNRLYSIATASQLPDILNFGTNDQESTELTIPYANAAVMLSDRTDAPDYMKFNINGWFEYDLDGQTYRLSSINFHSYYYPLYTYTPEQAESLTSLYPWTFFFIQEAEEITGRYRIAIESPASEVDILELLLK